MVETASGDPLDEHPVLARLLATGGSSLIAFRGYVGASSRDGYVSFYPRLSDLGKSYEIRGADIVHVEKIPETIAPFGAVMIWVRSDADVSSTLVANSRNPVPGNAGLPIESRLGRLRMRRAAPLPIAEVQTAGPGQNCASYCQDCSSQCNVCISGCTCY